MFGSGMARRGALLVAIALMGAMLVALSGTAGGLVSAWLMYYERGKAVPSSILIATFWTTGYWLGMAASLVVAAAALWFYIRRVRAS